MADIFISYSKAYRAQTEQLAQALQERGFTVWWDTSLVPGDSFKDVIVAELSRAQAAIVIWTPDSVRSDWVYSEASRARARRMLIPVRHEKVTLEDIPPPFDALHTELLSNAEAIEAALAKLGVKPLSPQPQNATGAARGGRLSEASVAEALALEHWQAIKQAADPQKLREFLAEFGASKSAKLARDRLAELEAQAWARLPKRRTAAQLRAFLADFPEGPKASAAEAELAALRRSRRNKAWRPPSAPAPSRRSINSQPPTPKASSPPRRKRCAPRHARGAKLARSAEDMKPMPAPKPRAGGCPHSPFHL